ncbi:MAG: serine/threonine protein kinase, partial [Planctomycetes bacterium]|nr:serine/threonine protein kinase [Planctomycetota bacterium]
MKTPDEHSDPGSAVGPASSGPRPPIAPHCSETVVNPERRGTRSVALQNVPAETSELWQRLFPPESDVLEGRAPDPAGIQLGHFVIEERIGMGGMGAVFRALDTRLQRYVALKVLSPFQARDPAAVQRFVNEGRAAARLDHDNIARVYHIGEEHGLNFIAFEFITGTNVRDLIRQRGRLEPAEAVNYTLQIASALRHTSAAGVIHRDIKPSNIIITPSGRAKLVDLGLARKIDSQSAPDLTVAGTTLGTFDYISPEQAKDPRNVDVRSDIYSLGCTLYHMLTGEPPYPEGTVLQKLLSHQGGEPPDP